MKTVPKSLHTVTVLVKLARHARGFIIMGDDVDRRSVTWAMDFLGYGDAPDDYRLASAALAQITKGFDL